MASRNMPATGTILILIAIWILINLFVGDLPKIIMQKSGISLNPVPEPIPNPTPNPTSNPTLNPVGNPTPDPIPPGVGPIPGDGGGDTVPTTSCPPGYINVLGLCVPVTGIPVPGRNPPGIPVPKLPPLPLPNGFW